MKALCWYGIKDIRLCEVPEPKVKPNEVKIKVKWCGICGSDIEMYLRGPIMPVNPPIILGHEFSGEIVEFSKEVTNFSVGERVVVDPYIICGTCFWCRRKEGSSLCQHLNIIGYTTDGGFAKYVCVPEKQVYKIGNLSYDIAALIQPTALGIHMAKRAQLKKEETVLIIGCGPIGIANIQASKAIGCKVIAVEISEARKEVAKKVGADLVLDAKEVNIKEEVLSQTENIGVDVAFECVGKENTMKTCFELTRKGGRIIAIGFSDALFPITVNELIKRKQTIIGTLGYGEEFPKTIKILRANKERARVQITAKITLDEIIDKGYIELIKNKDKHIKILVAPK